MESEVADGVGVGAAGGAAGDTAGGIEGGTPGAGAPRSGQEWEEGFVEKQREEGRLVEVPLGVGHVLGVGAVVFIVLFFVAVGVMVVSGKEGAVTQQMQEWGHAVKVWVHS